MNKEIKGDLGVYLVHGVLILRATYRYEWRELLGLSFSLFGTKLYSLPTFCAPIYSSLYICVK